MLLTLEEVSARVDIKLNRGKRGRLINPEEVLARVDRKLNRGKRGGSNAFTSGLKPPAAEPRKTIQTYSLTNLAVREVGRGSRSSVRKAVVLPALFHAEERELNEQLAKLDVRIARMMSVIQRV